MKLRKTLLLSIVFGLITSMVISNLAFAITQEDTSLNDIIDRGYIIIGAELQQAPFESINANTDEIEGFNIDIANVIASEIGKTGVRIEWIDTSFDTLLTGLYQDNYDCIISVLPITGENEREADFSRWYYRSSQAILVKTGYPDDAINVDSLNSSVYEIGVQAESTSNIYANNNLQQAELNTYTSITAAIESLDNETLVLGEHVELLNAIKDDKESYKIIGTFLDEDFGVAVNEGDFALLEKTNEILENLLGTDEEDPDPSDLYNLIYYKWFDMDTVGYTGTVTSYIDYTGSVTIPRAGIYRTAAPGFEVISIFLFIIAVPMLKRRK